MVVVRDRKKGGWLCAASEEVKQSREGQRRLNGISTIFRCDALDTRQDADQEGYCCVCVIVIQASDSSCQLLIPSGSQPLISNGNDTVQSVAATRNTYEVLVLQVCNDALNLIIGDID